MLTSILTSRFIDPREKGEERREQGAREEGAGSRVCAYRCSDKLVY